MQPLSPFFKGIYFGFDFDEDTHIEMRRKLSTLSTTGVKDVKWFDSYLFKRKQFVNACIMWTVSELINVTNEVHHSWTFVILHYANDMFFYNQSDCTIAMR